MKTYSVIYEGRVREVYSVEAESAEQAREIWSDFDPVSSEVIDGDIIEVDEDEQ